MNNINIFSEIGKLKKVMLHRPGRELNNLIPELMDELLFDEIPYLKEAQKEHDYFSKVLRDNHIEVVYLEDLVAEIIKDRNIKEELIEEYILENSIDIEKEKSLLRQYLASFEDEKELVLKLMEGTRREEIKNTSKNSLCELVSSNLKFITKPMPNLYFIRDPFTFVGNHVSLNKMWSKTRNRETLFGKYILKYHRDFKDVNLLYNRNYRHSIEGGDILVLSKDLICIGISQRTNPKAIEEFCKNLFNINSSFKTVLAFVLPKKREFMHLDTVFTMIDKDLFTIHSTIEKNITVYSISSNNGELKVNTEKGFLENILGQYLKKDNVKLIPCGGSSKVDAAREQWSDGSNTLAIAPREVIVYDRNTATNRELEENGVKLHIIKSGELSRGRGGPRCMSMPIIREEI
ncbi:arginine deiminase [Miniphocaeibacter halophilus]|uniref:Arginine deiminase n=1 Tax=Miniphocaeibacter halophilus TaxID=2931922 RepID=A0AC61N1Q6_9FIRM|nr:arginine deiminase [Miniphocaeibacter halophilus]QQK08726.1 arginine deiminase [Miniphocaeibacter halophilus]